MTATTSPPVTHSPAGTVARSFFEAYAAHDVDAMTDLCTHNADFHYTPFEVWGKQRVMRGDGKVCTIGKLLWKGLINAFPDLSTEVTSIIEDGAGNIALEVTISGTQSGPWGVIAPRGGCFSEPHLFVLRVNDHELIESVTAYWDNASIYRQLGHLEVD